MPLFDITQDFLDNFCHIARGVKEFRGLFNKAIKMVGHHLVFELLFAKTDISRSFL